MDAEVELAQERLVDLRIRAAAKTSAIEDQLDLIEEHAVTSALQGSHMTPEPDRKPSAEEKDSKPSADEDNARNDCGVHRHAQDRCAGAPRTRVPLRGLR